jgi:hypothetical protein
MDGRKVSFKGERRHRPGRRTAEAFCCHCSAKWEGSNCQGTAARHTDATGHQTVVEVTQCQIYFVPGKEWRF